MIVLWFHIDIIYNISGTSRGIKVYTKLNTDFMFVIIVLVLHY